MQAWQLPGGINFASIHMMMSASLTNPSFTYNMTVASALSVSCVYTVRKLTAFQYAVHLVGPWHAKLLSVRTNTHHTYACKVYLHGDLMYEGW